MSILDETQFVERLQFFNGQRLAASDVQGIDEFNRQMRWLHNQSLHQPGIGSGYAISGQKGDSQITVNPGYALDYLGREIVLTHPQTLPVPPVAGDGNGNSVFYALTVSYPEDSALTATETQQVVCAPAQAKAVRLQEKPVFCWIKLYGDQGDPADTNSKDDLQTHRKILLGQIEVLNCQLNHPPSIVQRCNARPDCGPHICCGQVSLSEFDLKPSRVDTCFCGLLTANGHAPWSVTKKIDTSQAKFLTTPHYSANIQGERIIPAGGETSVLALDQHRIEKASPDSFEVHLLIIPLPIYLFHGEESVARELEAKIPKGSEFIDAIKSKWSLAWMGVEQ